MSPETTAATVEKFMTAATQPGIARPTISEYTTILEQKGRLTPAVQESLDKAQAVYLGHAVVLYVAGPLTGMSEEVKDRYVAISTLAQSYDKQGANMFAYAPHLHGTDPIKHPNVTPQEVRDIDYLWAGVVPDGHINFVDPLAHGNAVEAGWAELHGTPMLYVQQENTKLSRLMLGMHNLVGQVVYSDFYADGLPQVDAFLQGVEAAMLSGTHYAARLEQ